MPKKGTCQPTRIHIRNIGKGQKGKPLSEMSSRAKHGLADLLVVGAYFSLSESGNREPNLTRKAALIEEDLARALGLEGRKEACRQMRTGKPGQKERSR